MTSGFMQGTKDGQPISIAIDHIIAYLPCGSGTIVYTDSSKAYCDIYHIELDQPYEVVNTLLQDFINNQRKYILDMIRKEFTDGNSTVSGSQE